MESIEQALEQESTGTNQECTESLPGSPCQGDTEAPSSLLQGDFTEFYNTYPNVSRDSLVNDTGFSLFIKGREFPSITKAYQGYCELREAIEREAVARERARVQNESCAVGSLSGEGACPNDFFTKEQVLKMTPQEIKKNYTKIRESQANW